MKIYKDKDIKIARAVPEGGVLTLSDAVAIATAHSREYQIEKENLYISALDLNLRSHELLRTNTADNNLDRFKYLSKADKKSKTMTQNKKNKIK